MTDGTLGVKDVTIPMHPHRTGEQRFVCYCGKSHAWDQSGVHTFVIPNNDRWVAKGWKMIQCPCGTWHMMAIQREDAAIPYPKKEG